MRNNSTGFGAAEKFMTDKLTQEMKLESMGSTVKIEDRLRAGLQEMESLKRQIALLSGFNLKQTTTKYNDQRKRCIKVRDELTVQREAAGATTNNTEAIVKQWPIPDAL